ncbi:MAG TPA: primosomal protein N' [Chlamydiales bacterium]|nr:primosomal protein N' [Chlamydiales bacterium]
MFQVFVEVLLDQNLQKKLDYAVPNEWATLVKPGMRVAVPLKNSVKKGTIVEIKNCTSWAHVRPIANLLSITEELSPEQWQLAHWIARYYAAPLQRVLKCFIPPNVRKQSQAKAQIYLTLNQPLEECKQTASQLRIAYPDEALVLDLMFQKNKGCFIAEFPDKMKKAVQRLIKKKILAAKKIPIESDLLLEEDFFQSKSKILNESQQNCLSAIEHSLSENQFAAHLIHGVTGSGKTEIYLQAIAKTLALQKAALLLVPEISLTSQTIERFRSRFSEKIAILHHKRSLGERGLAWERLRRGEIRIAIGARSAIFAPIQNLGLIIVDEEHDNSYKQSGEPPFYHARNVAVMRAHLQKAVVLLGSATPSIESRYNADIGKYKLHVIPSRATNAPLPKVQIVDMKKVYLKNSGFTHFSEELINGIEKRLQNGEQTLLFLNRRGYHRLQICASCSTVVKCPHCDLGLTYHRSANHLLCHLCHFQRETSRTCSQCGASNTLQFKGFGTEHVERSLHAVFPEIRTLRMDRDTTQKKESHETIFKQFRAHKADVLIGTQMIAKGFHFPSVTLVGVLNADAPLTIPDFRSSELVFQLLTQIAGRSGRSDLSGEVILQTFLPEHPVIHLAASHDYDSFYAAEIKERRLFAFPPFTHLIKCLFLSTNCEAAFQAARTARDHICKVLPSFAQALPAGPAGYPKIKDLYRFQFLIKTVKIDPLISLLQNLPQSNIQTRIDIDPISTFF